MQGVDLRNETISILVLRGCAVLIVVGRVCGGWKGVTACAAAGWMCNITLSACIDAADVTASLNSHLTLRLQSINTLLITSGAPSA